MRGLQHLAGMLASTKTAPAALPAVDSSQEQQRFDFQSPFSPTPVMRRGSGSLKRKKSRSSAVALEFISFGGGNDGGGSGDNDSYAEDAKRRQVEAADKLATDENENSQANANAIAQRSSTTSQALNVQHDHGYTANYSAQDMSTSQLMAAVTDKLVDVADQTSSERLRRESDRLAYYSEVEPTHNSQEFDARMLHAMGVGVEIEGDGQQQSRSNSSDEGAHEDDGIGSFDGSSGSSEQPATSPNSPAAGFRVKMDVQMQQRDTSSSVPITEVHNTERDTHNGNGTVTQNLPDDDQYLAKLEERLKTDFIEIKSYAEESVSECQRVVQTHSKRLGKVCARCEKSGSILTNTMEAVATTLEENDESDE